MNVLYPPQTVARTGELVDSMLGVKQYAEHVGAGERTVRTWLADGRLPGARKLNGVWMIPADERPTDAAPAAELVAMPHMPQVASVELAGGPGRLELELAEAPAFLELDAAARMLGIPVSAIRRQRAYFELVPFGERGRLVMPARVVRTVAGL